MKAATNDSVYLQLKKNKKSNPAYNLASLMLWITNIPKV